MSEELQMKQNTEKLLDMTLSTKQLEKAKQLASSLIPTSYDSVVALGNDAQQKVKQFSSNLFNKTRQFDPVKVQSILHEIANDLARINPDDLQPKSGNLFTKLLFRSKRSFQQTISEYKKLSKHVDRLALQLKRAQQELVQQQKQLHFLYNENADNFQELAIYLKAAQLKSEELKRTIEIGDNIDDVNIFGESTLTRLEETLQWLDQVMYNLQLSQEITRQSALQIRIVQQSNAQLIEKVQASVMTTIPLWQAQIATILSQGNQVRSAQVYKNIAEKSDQVSNNLDSARETITQVASNENSVHTIDQLKATQIQLLGEIEEALRIKVNQQQSS